MRWNATLRNILSAQLIFIDSYHVNRFHLYTCIATFMCFILVMFKNGKELLVHKGFMNLLTYTYVKSSEGSGWLASETRAHPNTVHHLICELQTLLVAILKLSSNNDVLVRMVKNNEEIPGVHANRIKKVCDNMYMLWSQRCLEPVSVFIRYKHLLLFRVRAQKGT